MKREKILMICLNSLDHNEYPSDKGTSTDKVTGFPKMFQEKIKLVIQILMMLPQRVMYKVLPKSL